MPIPDLGIAASEWVHRPTLFFRREREVLTHERIIDKVKAVTERVVCARQFELTDIEVTRQRGSHLVRLFVDREGGISLDDLQVVSEEVSAILDVEDPVSGPYTLEVSSPGLDRPLRSEAEFRRFVGRLAKISSYETVDGRRSWVGRIAACEEGVVTLTIEKESLVALIPLSKVAHARLEVEFP